MVADSEELSVTFIDNTTVKAAVKGTDSDSDLAVIAVKLSDIPDETKGKIQPAVLGDSDTLKPVSYTHLDVYKRQWLCFLILSK